MKPLNNGCFKTSSFWLDFTVFVLSFIEQLNMKFPLFGVSFKRGSSSSIYCNNTSTFSNVCMIEKECTVSNH